MSESQSLVDRLNKIELGIEAMAKVRQEASKGAVSEVGRTLISQVTGGVYDVFAPLLELEGEIHARMTETKKSLLLEAYLNKVDDMERGFEDLKAMVADAHGNLLLHHLFRVMEGYPLNRDYIGLLGNVLVQLIAEADFDQLFSRHQLLLRLLEGVSAQGLFLLSRYETFPVFSKPAPVQLRYHERLGEMVIDNDWSEDLLNALSFPEVLLPVILELIDQHLIIAKKTNDGYEVALGLVGQQLYPYLTS